MTRKVIKKGFILIGFIGGISAIILILITLIINSFIPLIKFIPENNIYIKYPEICFGIISLISLIYLLKQNTKELI